MTEKQALQQAIEIMWQKHQPQLMVNLARIERAATDLIAGVLQPEIQAEAYRAAHSLAGSTGTYGRHAASHIARHIETALSGSVALTPALGRNLATACKQLYAAMQFPSKALVLGKALCVDDNRDDLAALESTLRECGMEVVLLADPVEFHDRLLQCKPDIVLIAEEMALVKGTDLCRMVRTGVADRDLPVICLASHRAPQHIEALFQAGFDDYVPKPWSELELTSRVQVWLERRHLQSSIREITGMTGAESKSVLVDVVLIEDDDAMARFVEYHLTRVGIRSVRIADGTAAVNVLTGTGATLQPKVILLDVMLPGIDGYDVLKRLVEAGVTRTTKVIMLTVRKDEASVRRAVQSGAVGYLRKPINPEALIARVKAHLSAS